MSPNTVPWWHVQQGCDEAADRREDSRNSRLSPLQQDGLVGSAPPQKRTCSHWRDWRDPDMTVASEDSMLHSRDDSLLPFPVSSRSKGRSGKELGLARLLDCSQHASREAISGRDCKTTRVQTGSVWSSVSLYMWSTSFYRSTAIPGMHSADD